MALKPSSRDAQLAADLKKEVLSAMNADSSLTIRAAMVKITKEMLTNNPFVTPAGCPVNALPPELLAHIFVVGTEMEAEWDKDEDEEDGYESTDVDLKDGWTDEEDVDPDELDAAVVARLKSKGKVLQTADGAMDIDGDDDDSCSEEEEEEEEEETSLPFQVLVSHVCRHWRHVAIETPELWTTINFEEGAPFEKSKIWIQRGKGRPLDIKIDCSIPPVDEDPDGEEDDDTDATTDSDSDSDSDSSGSTESITSASHGHQYITEHANCVHEPPPISLVDLKEILEIIVPLVAQWRSLEVTTSVWEYMHVVLSRLSECPSAPLLETLEFYHYEDAEDNETFSPAELKGPFLIFNGNAPKLRNIALWGVHLDWNRSLTLLSDLHDLEMVYHTEDVRPSFATFAQIIASSPNLHNLGLCLSGPKEHDPENNDWGTNIIEIPSLKELVFCYHKPSYAIALLKKLCVPNVHSLTLDFDEEDYTEFVKQLTLPMPTTNKSILAGLEELKISGLPCNEASMKSMLDQLTGLKTINIKCLNEEEQTIYRQLFPTTVTEDGSTAQKQRMYCPNLHTITSTGIPGYEMRSLVEARRAAGVPIRRIMMSDEDDIEEEEIKWFRDNVEELGFFEASDEEFDVVDMGPEPGWFQTANNNTTVDI